MVLVRIKLFYQNPDGSPRSVPERYPKEIEIGGLDSPWDLSFNIVSKAIYLTMKSVGIEPKDLDPKLMIRWEIGKSTPLNPGKPTVN